MTSRPGLGEMNIAILGLGLMGGSLALALQGKCARLLGIDRNPDTISQAVELGITDRASIDPAELLPHADLVIFATPVRAILALLEELPNLHPGSAMVLDLGSTKQEIVTAMNRLPDRFDPIGGHPMCGKESSGLAHIDSNLYREAPFALTSLPRTSIQTRNLAKELVQAIGARPIWIDPETHDRWVAATSHLPYLIANVLAGSTPVEAAPLIGPGYRSTSRLAVSPVEMMIDVLTTNRASLLEALQRFHHRLELIESYLVDGDFRLLHDSLAQAAEHQARLLDSLAHGGVS